MVTLILNRIITTLVVFFLSTFYALGEFLEATLTLMYRMLFVIFGFLGYMFDLPVEAWNRAKQMESQPQAEDLP